METTIPPTDQPEPGIENPIQPTPPQEAASAYGSSSTMLVIPRVLVNYIIIAIVCFTLGAVVGGGALVTIFNANSVENRQIVADAVAAVAQNQVAQQPVGLQQGERYEVTADDDPTRGDPNAPITIVEFADFRCQYCGKFFAETMEPLLENYDGQIHLVYRDYPILGPDSLTAALGAGCALDQGKYWEFHDLTYQNQQDLSREMLISHAETLSLNVDVFTTCLDEQQHIEEITADAIYAQNLGVTGTPAFFINGRFLSGAQPYAVFAAAIDEELGRLTESTPDPTGSS
ncbi:MAG: DsbA family protein [Anaerolineae bacterium]|nr:DsbA family protein [Anaerolineae bacterium]